MFARALYLKVLGHEPFSRWVFSRMVELVELSIFSWMEFSSSSWHGLFPSELPVVLADFGSSSLWHFLAPSLLVFSEPTGCYRMHKGYCWSRRTTELEVNTKETFIIVCFVFDTSGIKWGESVMTASLRYACLCFPMMTAGELILPDWTLSLFWYVRRVVFQWEKRESRKRIVKARLDAVLLKLVKSRDCKFLCWRKLIPDTRAGFFSRSTLYLNFAPES